MENELRRWIRLVEGFESVARYRPPYDALYHGTTLERAKLILSSSFDLALAGSKTNAPLPAVSTSLNMDIAQEHAEWAVKKFGGEPAVLIIDPSNLNILSGSRFLAMGDFMKAVQRIKRTGRYDAAEVFDVDEGDGIEEMEVLIFNLKKIRARLA